jgi:hypothetical protein
MLSLFPLVSVADFAAPFGRCGFRELVEEI